MCEFSIKAVLTDIEGTTTSISFVKDTLFPYSKKNAERYLRETWESKETRSIIKDLMESALYQDFIKQSNYENSALVDMKLMSLFVNYLIDEDVKLGALKTLQGHIWAEGYKSGDIKGHVYTDVPAAFKRWHDDGITLAIYSSGSIKAQQLLFGQTELGNLLPYIKRHFDTSSGNKQNQQSYTNISQILEIAPKDILFLTDIVKEAEAAGFAGYQTVILSRPGNAPLTDDEKSLYTVVDSFESLKLKAN